MSTHRTVRILAISGIALSSAVAHADRVVTTKVALETERVDAFPETRLRVWAGLMLPGTWGGQLELQSFGGLIPGLFVDVTAMATTGTDEDEPILGGRARLGLGSRRWGYGGIARWSAGNKVTGDIQPTLTSYLPEKMPTTLVGNTVFVVAEGRTGLTMAFFGIGVRREEARDLGLRIDGSPHDIVNFRAIDLSVGYAFGEMGGIRANFGTELRAPEFPLYTRLEIGAAVMRSEDNVGWTKTLLFNLVLGGSVNFSVRSAPPRPE